MELGLERFKEILFKCDGINENDETTLIKRLKLLLDAYKYPEKVTSDDKGSELYFLSFSLNRDDEFFKKEYKANGFLEFNETEFDKSISIEDIDEIF